MGAVMTRPRCRLPMHPRGGEPQFCGRAANHPGNHLTDQAYQRLLEAKRKPPRPSWPEPVRQEMLRELDSKIDLGRRQAGMAGRELNPRTPISGCWEDVLRLGHTAPDSTPAPGHP